MGIEDRFGKQSRVPAMDGATGTRDSDVEEPGSRLGV